MAAEILLGTEKARWQFSKFSGFSTIEYDSGTYGFGKKYIVDNSIEFSESSSAKVEAKEYVYYIYDAVNEEYIEETNATWVYRIKGTWLEDQAALFELPDFMMPTYSYDVHSSLQTLDAKKELVTVLQIPFLEVTKQDLLDYIAE